MASISNNFLRLGVLSAVVGMSLGAWMGANENFTLRAVHAHINLVGFAGMILFGLFYRMVPEAARGWMAAAHLILWVVGFLIMMPALTLMLLGNTSVLMLMPVSESMLIVAMVLFVIIVFRHTGRAPAPAV